MTQLRLENYIYTRESIATAYRLLDESGELLFYNSYRSRWVRDKIVVAIREATGRSPRVLHVAGEFAMLAVGPRTEGPEVAASEAVDAATDDWPFPYLPRHGIPAFYLEAMGGVLVLVFVLALLVEWRTRTSPAYREATLRTQMAFLLMGAAFLLLETKGVIQFSLLFGTTWLNNSLVFLAILILVLLANWTARAFGRYRIEAPAYGLLMAFCAAAVAFPLGGLLRLQDVTLRFAAASILTFAPIYFANLIFSLAYRDQSVPDHVFGWNLIGAALGGTLEYASLAVGYNALAWVVGIAYTLAFILLPRPPRPSTG
jgi:hypothetical protein